MKKTILLFVVFALLVNLWNHVKAQTNMGWNELGFQSNKGSVSSSGGISPSPICIDKHDNIYSIQQDLIHIKKWDGINWADITSNFKSKILCFTMSTMFFVIEHTNQPLYIIYMYSIVIKSVQYT